MKVQVLMCSQTRKQKQTPECLIAPSSHLHRTFIPSGYSAPSRHRRCAFCLRFIQVHMKGLTSCEAASVLELFLDQLRRLKITRSLCVAADQRGGPLPHLLRSLHLRRLQALLTQVLQVSPHAHTHTCHSPHTLCRAAACFFQFRWSGMTPPPPGNTIFLSLEHVKPTSSSDWENITRLNVSQCALHNWDVCDFCRAPEGSTTSGLIQNN